MEVVCDRCDFKGEEDKFVLIGNAMCCGPLVFRRCPKCGSPVICDRQEMQANKEEAARSATCQIEDAVEKRDFDTAKEFMDVLYLLNESLNIDAINEYLRQTKRKIRQLKDAAPAP